jgi:hypothetical protein
MVMPMTGSFVLGIIEFDRQAVEKRTSVSLRSSFVFAAYEKVRLIPHDFIRLASGYF